MEKKIHRSINLYPLYYGLSADLLFYIAINTLFLSIVKGFTASQIVSLNSISQLVCIALEFPCLFVIKKIGNTASVRVAAFLMLFSSVFITFGNGYFIVLFGKFLHDVSLMFQSASIVALENNLDLVDRRKDFVRLRTSGNTMYSVITMLISFVASFMFNLYHYLPMIGSITACTVCLVVSFFIKDFSDNNKIQYKKKRAEKPKVKYSYFILIAVLMYGVFYAAVNSGQNEGKLFIQEHLLLDFNVENTALILGAIVCVSRIIRVLSNIVFAKVYEKYLDKIGIFLTLLLSLSIAFILFGTYIPTTIVKILIMGFGYTIILFVRDPFRLYIVDVLFEKIPKEQHQTLLATLKFSTKVGIALLGLVFSAILLAYPMKLVMSIVFGISIVVVILSIIVYRSLSYGKKIN